MPFKQRVTRCEARREMGDDSSARLAVGFACQLADCYAIKWGMQSGMANAAPAPGDPLPLHSVLRPCRQDAYAAMSHVWSCTASTC